MKEQEEEKTETELAEIVQESAPIESQTMSAPETDDEVFVGVSVTATNEKVNFRLSRQTDYFDMLPDEALKLANCILQNLQRMSDARILMMLNNFQGTMQ